MSVKSVCLVLPVCTPRLDMEFIGANLIRDAANSGVQLTLVLEGKAKRYESLEGLCLESGFRFVNLNDWQARFKVGQGLQNNFEAHYKVLDFLERSEFDEVVAPDYRGLIYFALLKKRHGLGFSETVFTTLLKKPSIVAHTATDDSSVALSSLGIAYIERKVSEFADCTVIDQSLKQSIGKAGYQFLESNKIEIAASEKCQIKAGKPSPITTLDFLLVSTPEPVLRVYLKAMTRWVSRLDDFVKIRFFINDLRNSHKALLKDTFKGLKKDYEVHSFNALSDYASNNVESSVAVIYKARGVNEWLPRFLGQQGLPFIFCELPEIHGGISANQTDHNEFEIYPQSFIDCLTSFVQGDRRCGYDSESFNWNAFRGSGSVQQERNGQCGENPLVSVCVVHHERPAFLLRVLEAFKRQDYENNEILVIDDGSYSDSTVAQLKQIDAEYASDTCRFYYQENKWLGAARNELARSARGEYLVFFDDDNIPLPQFISTYVKAIKTSNVDALTCFQLAFVEDEFTHYPDFYPEPRNIFTPVGGASALGLFDNFFGDASCIIKKSVFCEVGGYWHLYGLPKEDHDFYTRLVAAGYQLEVLPVPLYYYRLSGSGMMNSNSSNKAFDFSVNQITSNTALMPNPNLSALEYRAIQLLTLGFWRDRLKLFRMVPHWVRKIRHLGLRILRRLGFS